MSVFRVYFFVAGKFCAGEEGLRRMQVVLLERVSKLGFIGDVVNVKTGYARNFLLPQKKALRATPANLEYFALKKADIEATNLKLKKEAEVVAAKLNDVSVILIRQASESGFLFGSVRAGDIAEELAGQGFVINKSQVKIDSPIKTIGTHRIAIILHPEVISEISLRVMTAQEQSAPIEQDSDENEDGELVNERHSPEISGELED
ncbi:MAG: 50S ribosomal protein L9 [Holosporales bacterium]|jgi:large subunit ribosomal protein L9|nr:50S ribosomal protein L9 [Holosporales bacterium]